MIFNWVIENLHGSKDRIYNFNYFHILVLTYINVAPGKLKMMCVALSSILGDHAELGRQESYRPNRSPWYSTVAR